MPPSFVSHGLVLLLACAAPRELHALAITGEVRSDESASVFTPLSDVSPVVLRHFASDGAHVRKGEVILRIDAAQAATHLRRLEADTEQYAARSAREEADLRLKKIAAEMDLVDAQAELDAAAIDASIPRSLLSPLDFDRNRNELDRTTRNVAFRQQKLTTAQAVLERHEQVSRIEMEKLRIAREADRLIVAAAEVRATRDGVLVHAFSNWAGNNGARLDEGSTSYPGQLAGEIIGGGKVHVAAFVLEPDRHAVSIGDRLCLRFDGLPRKQVDGRIRRISTTSEARPEWGAGRYFTLDVDLPEGAESFAIAGMSVRAETPCATGRIGVADKTGPVLANGEVYPRAVTPILLPEVDGIWQFTITRMANDGEAVKQGDLIVAFDTGDLSRQLIAGQNALAEQRLEREKQQLEMSEAMHEQDLVVAEAEANATKAALKTNLPVKYVPGIELRKLLINRHRAEQRLDLYRKRRDTVLADNEAQRKSKAASFERLQADLERIRTTIASLSITAPRDGIFLHSVNLSGKKLVVGDPVYVGQSVGSIPDMATLAVRAALPERDFARVKKGQAARILVEGAGASLAGYVESIGTVVHSKSGVAPVPVVDLQISLVEPSATFNPHQPVRVEILADPASSK
ncbi:HlyD family efflux transporter periplasmic adaptor subunit [Rudaea sp. 3F27F6]|uniref:HlyD family secretion protein n=1 Tax=Rudaea sp. 3F27F6 TaxID=2502208 RepID=UPI0010F53A54|nr:HlyD family efflux transporter periplasmic adaptor subunit [Rudaea sp. 3F27F6]